MRTLWTGLVMILAWGAATLAASAQGLAFDSGSDGSDGELVVPDSTVQVLNMNDGLHDDGIYNFTSVTINAGATLEITPNDNNTPVVILVQNDFIMGCAAKILVNGRDGGIPNPGVGGPGGFDGGVGGVDNVVPQLPGPGLGPGGGIPNLEGDDMGLDGGRNNFMRPSLVPLIGGAGGGGAFATLGSGNSGGGGAGGGGAILIAASGRFELSTCSGSLIDASGGNSLNSGGSVHSGGGGAGGAIRIIASQVDGGWLIDAEGGVGGGTFGEKGGDGEDGIIRIETFRLTRNFNIVRGRMFNSLPGIVDGDAADLSTLRISSIGGVAVPDDAGANVALPDVIIPAGVTNPVRIDVEATNVTPGQTAMVRLNYTGNGGPIIEAETSALAGTAALSTAFVDVNLAAGSGTIAAILRTDAFTPQIPPAAPQEQAALNIFENMRVTLDGEPVEFIERTREVGQAGERVEYVTASGRRAAVPVP